MLDKKLLTVACAAVFATLSAGAQAQYSGNVVKIGVLTDLSGTYPTSPAPAPVLPPKWRSPTSSPGEADLQDRDGQLRPPEQGRHRRQQGPRVVRARGVDTATELVTTSTALAVMKIAGRRTASR